jgi:hypothetical protein
LLGCSKRKQIRVRAMTTSVKATKAARAEARAELAAIRAAKPIYSQPKELAKAEATEAAAETEARAKAGTTDSRGMAAGQIVRAGTAEAEARARAEAKARAELPKVTEAKTEAKPARLAWHIINGREYAAAEAREFWAEQRAMDIAARAKTRAEARAAELAAYGPRAVLHVMPEAELRAKAKAARAEATAEVYIDATARAEAMGVELSEVLEADAQDALMAAVAKDETFGNAPEAGAYSVMSPKSYALFQSWTRQQLDSPAARAGRLALDALGVTAQAVVTVPFGGQQLTISELVSVPDLATAKARAKAAKAAAKAARKTAKAAFKAAEATHMTREKLAKAEAEAGRLATLTAKAEAKAARAKVVKAAAKAANDIPGKVTGWTIFPLARVGTAEAARAGSLPVRHAVGMMPATYAHKGPEAKAARAKTDNTATEAIANVMEQTAEAEAAAAEALAASIRAKLAELTEAARAAKDKQRSDYKARQNLALRIKRRAAKNK